MSEPIRLQDIAVPVILILVLFIVVLMIPQLGMVVGIFSPVPLIYIYLKHGKKIGFIGVGVVIIILAIVLGVRHAVFFATEYGILALVMAEAISLRFSFERTIFFGALASAVAAGILLFLSFQGKEFSLSEFLQEQAEGHLRQSLSTLKELDQQVTELESIDENTLSSLVQKLAWSYPAFIFSGSLFVSLINYGVVRLLWKRLGGNFDFFADSFSNWILPDFFIWVLIGSAFGVWFAPETSIFAFSLNALVLAIVVYCLQGLAISVFFLEAKSIPTFLWVVLFIFIFTQPLLIGILIGMGVFDFWVDFRKIKSERILPNSENGE